MIPPGAVRVSPRIMMVTVAVIGGARTVREVKQAVDAGSLTTMFEAMRDARHVGLISWQDKHGGTLHPQVKIVWAPTARKGRNEKHHGRTTK